MGEEEDVSVQENGLTVDHQEERKDKDNKKKKEKKKKKKGSVDGGDESVEGEEERPGKLKQGKKRKAGNEDLATDVEMCLEKESETDGGNIKKKKKKRSEDVSDDSEGKAVTNEEGDGEKQKKKKLKSTNLSDGVEVSDGVGDESEELEKSENKKEKKRKRRDISSAGEEDKDKDDNGGKKKKEKKAKSGKGEKGAENSTAKRSSKRVSFSDNLEVLDEVPNKKARPLQNKENREGLVQGKRFTREEDDMIRESVSKYIEEHNLGENGIDMILNCSAHKEVRHCWKEIADRIPHRPRYSVSYRAHVIYERADTRKWTDEDKEYVKEFYKKHGPDWKKLATELNRHRIHVKEAWRRNRLENKNRGRWSQKEYQTLFDLVNKDLSMRVLEERKSKHGMIRDNIPWDAISDTMATRHTASCCLKWYQNLTSPLVSEGLWSDTDDYKLVNALLELDATNIDEVMWDYLLEHRDGETAYKRWNQMVKYIGEYSKLSFSQQVEVLGQRYSPKFIPAREEFDSKPFVDC